ncbi:hypothetical protein EYF80_010527 [Liparis tanakae]|uniref:Uncharacterized protein n=1 Tax=Liparis tanakae TaxID=230148 RepID=A0A4Z2IPZ6_9TELE|nr:hypothetical protein EYF80_010527 [Liparis tanakae]
MSYTQIDGSLTVSSLVTGHQLPSLPSETNNHSQLKLRTRHHDKRRQQPGEHRLRITHALICEPRPSHKRGGVIRTSAMLVTYLVTNSVWHEARWEMGRRKESVNRPLKRIPEAIHLAAKEDNDDDEEEDEERVQRE